MVELFPPPPCVQDQQSILYCLASVLHICDVSFASEDEGSAVSNPDKVETVAKLLQVDPQELAACLVQEAVVTRGERKGMQRPQGSPRELIKAKWVGVVWAEFLPT